MVVNFLFGAKNVDGRRQSFATCTVGFEKTFPKKEKTETLQFPKQKHNVCVRKFLKLKVENHTLINELKMFDLHSNQTLICYTIVLLQYNRNFIPRLKYWNFELLCDYYYKTLSSFSLYELTI